MHFEDTGVEFSPSCGVLVGLAVLDHHLSYFSFVAHNPLCVTQRYSICVGLFIREWQNTIRKLELKTRTGKLK